MSLRKKLEKSIIEIWQGKHISLILSHIPIKYIPEGTNVLCLLIDPIIKECEYSGARICFARHFSNVTSQIKCIDFDPYYSPVTHADSFRINIYFSDMHRFNARILDVSNAFHNTNVPIN